MNAVAARNEHYIELCIRNNASVANKNRRRRKKKKKEDVREDKKKRDEEEYERHVYTYKWMHS